VKILLDECVPARFGRLLTGHSATTVPRHGWAGIKNGDLLALAEKEFDALITVDQKLPAEPKSNEDRHRRFPFARADKSI
jgi:predicted nuclease of predicted toxin-antitoxin system